MPRGKWKWEDRCVQSHEFVAWGLDQSEDAGRKTRRRAFQYHPQRQGQDACRGSGACKRLRGLEPSSLHSLHGIQCRTGSSAGACSASTCSGNATNTGIGSARARSGNDKLRLFIDVAVQHQPGPIHLTSFAKWMGHHECPCERKTSDWPHRRCRLVPPQVPPGGRQGE